MIDELLISATPFGVRTALVANGNIRAFNTESHARPGLLGNIYMAAPGRQGGAARFVAISEGQSAFLAETSSNNLANPLVQVVRDGLAGKAPRVSTEPALAGRYLVFFPTVEDTNKGASLARRIEGEDERARLRAIGQDLATAGGGITLRSAAVGAPEDMIRAEAARLRSCWSDIASACKSCSAPALLFAGPNLAERLIRDILPATTKHILIDDKKTHAKLSAFLDETAPELRACLHLVDDALFERHDAAGALDAALAPEVALPGGGRLMIEPTEALTVIDVDSGVRSGARASALSAACSEAAATAAEEIQRRNIVGQIIIDFPRLGAASVREALLRDMQKHMRKDPVAHKVVAISPSGLMEITRRRAETPLLEALSEAAPRDSSDGYGSYGGYGVRWARLDTLAFDIADQARQQVRPGTRRVTLRMASELAKYMAQFDAAAIRQRTATLGEWLSTEVTVQQEPGYKRDQWTVETI